MSASSTTKATETETRVEHESINTIEQDFEQDIVEPDDPCNSYQWSIVFLLILTVAIILAIFQCFVMYRRRQNLLSALDIGFIFLAFCTIIQFGPMTSQVLHAGHGISGFTQSGCKLSHFTEYGVRHVILSIVVFLITYAWLITKQNFNQEQVDKRVRHSLPWLILLAFAIEGVFGMPVAIYVDVLPGHSYV